MKVHNLQLAFIGRILSCYTHEVNNYLAIIKETGGLMRDVLRIKKAKGMDEKQFIGLVDGIDEQIRRATAITDYLHRFGHRMEKGCARVGINELIDELLALMGRLAYRKRLTFRKNTTSNLPETVINSTLFHYLLFCIIETKMSTLDRNGVVCVGASFSEGCFRITVGAEGATLSPTDPAEAIGTTDMSDAASELGATVLETGNETIIKIPVAEQHGI
jgi:C4-dicarboxylate-specific signal transduction histidine kinase